MKKTISFLSAVILGLLMSSCAVRSRHFFDVQDTIDRDSGCITEKSLDQSPFAEERTEFNVIIEPETSETKSDDTTAKPAETTKKKQETTKPKETTAEEKIDIDDFDIGIDDEEDDIPDDTDYFANFIFEDMGLYSEKVDLYDVPLGAAKQKFVFELADEFGVPAELIFGVMKVESNYNETVISKNGKYIGAMQIAKSNLKTLNKKFGITDLQDFRQNATAGAYFLSYYYKKYNGDVDKTLMCYHRGEGGAQKKWKEGVMTDGYCTKVKKEMTRIINAGVVK